MEGAEGSQPDRRQIPAFIQSLSALKRGGSTLLVTGTASCSARQQVCLRLLGDDAAGVRRRVVVLAGTHRTTVSDTSPPPQLATHPRTVITHQSHSRSATSSLQTDELSVTPHCVETDDLADLEATLAESITTIEEDTALSPAELRVCFDSLVPLVDQHDSDVIERFLQSITERIRTARGMGHFHLPIDRDREIVRQLAPLFDVELELRAGDDGMQQRWHLRRVDMTSEWLRLSSVF